MYKGGFMGDIVAIKVVQLKTDNQRELLAREVALARTLRSQHLVNPFGSLACPKYSLHCLLCRHMYSMPLLLSWSKSMVNYFVLTCQVSCLGMSLLDSAACLVMQYMSGGNLMEALADDRTGIFRWENR